MFVSWRVTTPLPGDGVGGPCPLSGLGSRRRGGYLSLAGLVRLGAFLGRGRLSRRFPSAWVATSTFLVLPLARRSLFTMFPFVLDEPAGLPQVQVVIDAVDGCAAEPALELFGDAGPVGHVPFGV